MIKDINDVLHILNLLVKDYSYQDQFDSKLYDESIEAVNWLNNNITKPEDRFFGLGQG